MLMRGDPAVAVPERESLDGQDTLDANGREFPFNRHLGVWTRGSLPQTSERDPGPGPLSAPPILPTQSVRLEIVHIGSSWPADIVFHGVRYHGIDAPHSFSGTSWLIASTNGVARLSWR